MFKIFIVKRYKIIVLKNFYSTFIPPLFQYNKKKKNKSKENLQNLNKYFDRINYNYSKLSCARVNFRQIKPLSLCDEAILSLMLIICICINNRIFLYSVATSVK